jgi:hypothetical protein
VRQIAEEPDFDQDLLATRADIALLVVGRPSRLDSGWPGELAGGPICRLVAGEVAAAFDGRGCSCSSRNRACPPGVGTPIDRRTELAHPASAVLNPNNSLSELGAWLWPEWSPPTSVSPRSPPTVGTRRGRSAADGPPTLRTADVGL